MVMSYSTRYRARRPLSIKLIFTVIGLTYLFIFVLGFSLWAMSIAASRAARAHKAPSGWTYPIECCSGMDCAPVTHAIRSAEGILQVTTQHGTAIVSPQLQPRESKDGQMHACIVKNWQGETYVRCIFLPPTT